MGSFKEKLVRIFRDWMLVIGMAAGSGAYLIYHAIKPLHVAGPYLKYAAVHIQPVLLFCMLFLTFCRIEPRQMRPHRWQGWLLLVQGGFFVAIALLLMLAPQLPLRMGVEAFMLCMICPTATACAVVTGKLGGDMAGVVTYTILINLLVAVLVPAMVPLIHPVEGLSFVTASAKIMAKVFPLLILPCLLAWLVRYLMPHLHAFLVKNTDIPFYIWACSLMLALLMSTRALVNSDEGLGVLLDIAIASAISCALQFWLGKIIGGAYGSKKDRITAGQALGQKNTVFGIWMGYTFLDPVVSVAGGFYSIWHNVFNSWQLYRARKENEK